MRKKADDSRFQIGKRKEIKISNSKYFEIIFLADSL